MRTTLKLFVLVTILFITGAASAQTGSYIQGNDSPSGSGGISNYSTGGVFNWWWPAGNAAANGATVNFPGTNAASSQTVTATVSDSIWAKLTYITVDTLGNGDSINLVLQPTCTGGEEIFINTGASQQTSHKVYITNSGVMVDTLTYKNIHQTLKFLYTGAAIVPTYK